MKIVKIETIRIKTFPNLLWVKLHSNEGLIGLGETFYGVGPVEKHIHEIIAFYLLGKDFSLIEMHQSNLIGYLGFKGTSAEMRARSAVDIALWDLWGKSINQPIHKMLGGKVRDKIRVYNTCAGSDYIKNEPTQSTNNFGLKKSGLYEDLDGFLHRADELAHSLLEMDISAMKIWPFDYAAEESFGHYISNTDLKKALVPFQKIRKSLGDKMDIMAELHSMWNRPEAVKISRALEEYKPFWIEDPVKMDQLSSLDKVANSTINPIAAGETLGGSADYKSLIEMNCLSLIILDVSWGGGFSEARRIADMAETSHVPVAFHDCTGPVALTASIHLALSTKNCYIQEIVRAFYFGWYKELVDCLPPLNNGFITAPDGDGLGISLLTDVTKRKDCKIMESKI